MHFRFACPLILVALALFTGTSAMSRTVDPKRVFSEPRVVALCDAAQRGNVSDVQRLLAEGVNPKTRGDRDITPLTFALIARSAEPARLMLAAGADPNAVQTDGIVPLYYTLVKDDTTQLKLMLDHGADPNAVMPGGSVLEQALMHGNLPAIEILLARRADPNRKRSGTPLLHKSLAINLPEAASLLVRANADLMAVDKDGTTFLALMCRAADKYTYNPQDQIYKGYIALWQELVRRGHTPPCPQPF